MLLCACNIRYKVVIQAVQDTVARVCGITHSKTNSNLNCCIQNAVFCQWPTVVPIAMAHSCMCACVRAHLARCAIQQCRAVSDHALLCSLYLLCPVCFSFILFKSAPHLNNKHTVFGKVVGGMEVLRKIELIPVDDADRPTVCHSTPCLLNCSLIVLQSDLTS
jgi:hypothetical protein